MVQTLLFLDNHKVHLEAALHKLPPRVRLGRPGRHKGQMQDQVVGLDTAGPIQREPAPEGGRLMDVGEIQVALFRFVAQSRTAFALS